MHALLQSALAYARAGLSVIPCDRQRKQPRLRHWKPYQAQAPPSFQLLSWFAPWSPANALAIVTGPVSGGLEALDFDAPALFTPWADAVHRQNPDVLASLPLVRTQSGGYHVYFRCAGTVAGNQKLAVDPARPGGKFTLIETRGTGGYVLAPPSAGYTLLQGDLTAIPLLDAPARAVLLDTARRFSRAALSPERPRPPAKPRSSTTPRPGDDYNRRGDVSTLLEHHGWRCVRQVREASYWRRPGKARGHSATYNYRASRCFYVFTSNAPPFDAGRAYSPFAVFALLEHHGDYRAAATALRRLGYGMT